MLLLPGGERIRRDRAERRRVAGELLRGAGQGVGTVEPEAAGGERPEQQGALQVRPGVQLRFAAGRPREGEGREVHPGLLRQAAPSPVRGDRRPLCGGVGRRKHPGPDVGDPAGLQFQRHEVAARLVPHPDERQAGQIRVEGVPVGLEVDRVERDGGPDVVVEEREVEGESGAEDDAVERLGAAVAEGDVAPGHRRQPRPDPDPALGDEREVVLAERDPGREQ